MQKRWLGRPFRWTAGLGLGLAILGCEAGEGPRAPGAGVDGGVGPRVSEILRGSDPLERVRELSALLPALGPEALPALLGAFETAPIEIGDPELQLLGLWWARFDPGAAHQWTLVEWRAKSGPVIAAVYRSWAHEDPEAALAMALRQRLPGQREFALDAVVSGWDESGRAGLVQALASLDAAEQQRLAETFAARRVLTLGPAGAFEWLATLSDMPRFQQVMEVRIASSAAGLAGGGPLAAEWATPRVRSDDRLSHLPRRIATRWIVRDPEAAMAWLASLPAGADRSDGVTEAFRTWLRRDRAGASAWIQATELEPWNEPALALHAKSLAREDPERALELALRIGDAPLRDATLINIGQAWTRRDREAAQTWLAATDVSESVRERFLVSGNEVRERRRAVVEQRQRELRERAAAQTDVPTD